MTPAEQQIRDALAAGPTPGPWQVCADGGAAGPKGAFVPFGGCGCCGSPWMSGENPAEQQANAELIAACNPAALTELLAELDGERARSQMYADLVRGVAVALRGPGYSDTSKLPQEVAALKAELDRLRAERDAAVGLLASWCVSVDHNGTGWDDWDEDYKDARYRPGPLREALDKAIAEERQHRGITGD